MRMRYARIVMAVLTGLIIATPAYAYIDPGTGSFIVQGIIAAVIGAGVVFKLFWHKIKAVLTGKSVATDDDDDD